MLKLKGSVLIKCSYYLSIIEVFKKDSHERCTSKHKVACFLLYLVKLTNIKGYDNNIEGVWWSY